MIINDPIVAAFAGISVNPTAGISGGILQMELASAVMEARSHPKPSSMMSASPDPILQSIEDFLKIKRVHMTWNKIAFIGCSAGGDVALRTLMKNIVVPHIPIVIAMHHNPGFKFMTKFQMKNGLAQRVQIAKDGESIRSSKVYFLPGDMTNNFKAGTKSFSVLPLRQKPKFHPVIDEVFANAGVAFKRDAISIILSGMLNDGAEGLKTMALNSAFTIVQAPGTALFKDMPTAAMKSSPLSKVWKLEEMATQINQMSRDNLKYEKLGGFAFASRSR